MAMSMGNFMLGEEGQSVWRLFSSPVSARSLVKSKFFFIVLFSLIVLAITGAVGSVIYHPTANVVIIALVEGIFLIWALGALSLSNGISGADFTETPRPRMIRQSTAILNFVACSAAGAGILAPFVPYLMSSTLSSLMPGLGKLPFLNPYLATVLSAIIALVLTAIFYRFALKNAREFLKKAEI
jgi:uncharacterized protein YacL